MYIDTNACLSAHRDKCAITHWNFNNGCLWGVRLENTINYVGIQRWYVLKSKSKI